MAVWRLNSPPASTSRHVGLELPALDAPGIDAHAPTSTREAKRCRRTIIALATFAIALGAGVVMFAFIRQYLQSELPYVPTIKIYETLVDSTPVVVTFPATTAQTLDQLRDNLPPEADPPVDLEVRS
jgi:hypothetical protein